MGVFMTYKELKELSGMTFEQLAEFHNVTSRTVKYWTGDAHRAPKDSFEKLLNYVERKSLT